MGCSFYQKTKLRILNIKQQYLLSIPLKICLEVKYWRYLHVIVLEGWPFIVHFTCFDQQWAGAVCELHICQRETHLTTLGVLWTCRVVLVLCKVAPRMDMCVALLKWMCIWIYWFWQKLVDYVFMCMCLSAYTSLWIVVCRGTAFFPASAQMLSL